MDKFAFWTLKVLSYLFLISAAASLIMWIAEKDTYSHPATPWIIWVSAIFTSLFFSATSHVLSRMIERIFSSQNEEGYDLSVYDNDNDD